jgi:hypothetical protein
MEARLSLSHACALAPFAFVVLVSSAAAAEPVSVKQQCIAANENGQNDRRNLRLHDAIDRFDFCAQKLCPPVLREDCAARKLEAESAMPSVTLVARDAKDGQPVRATVRIDDGAASPVPASKISLEPGDHAFVFSAEGYANATFSAKLTEKQNERVVAELVKEAAESTPPTREASADDGSSSTPKLVAYAVGGVGVASLIAGGAFGIVAKSTYEDAIASCQPASGGHRQCTPAGVDRGSSADGQALASTIFVTAGLTLVVAAVVLYVVRAH